MAQRTWFTPEICEGLAAQDCSILNRAARNAFPVGDEPRHLDLVTLRTVYRPGMSAAELLKAAGFED